jgi:putative transposase
MFFGKTRGLIGQILRELCKQRGIELLEGNAAVDHVHMLLSIPPKYSVANTVGFLKGKSAVRIHRELLRQKRMTGLHFWTVGYCVSTGGLDEATIRRYVEEHDKRDKDMDQRQLDFE